MKTILKILAYALTSLGVLVIVAAGGILAYDVFNRPNIVAGILKIETIPKSLKVIDCESPFTTDVLTTCAIEIAPEEFKDLLVGYEFEHSPVKRSSFSVGSTPVGPEFEVTSQYRVWPKEFTHGGAIHIFASKDKDRAILDLYIE